jgi:hypothetical protein
MNDNLLETRQLSNGTTLNLYDASRRQGADRWIVVMEAHLEIPVDDRCLPQGRRDGLTLETIRETLGHQVVYVSRKERVFVPDEDKAALLTAFQAEFCRNAVPYLLHPAFPPRFILKQYREHQKKKAWQDTAAAPPDQDRS